MLPLWWTVIMGTCVIGLQKPFPSQVLFHTGTESLELLPLR